MSVDGFSCSAVHSPYTLYLFILRSGGIGLDRLTSSNGPWGPITYSYDAAGNRMSKTEGGATTYYSYRSCKE